MQLQALYTKRDTLPDGTITPLISFEYSIYNKRAVEGYSVSGSCACCVAYANPGPKAAPVDPTRVTTRTKTPIQAAQSLSVANPARQRVSVWVVYDFTGLHSQKLA